MPKVLIAENDLLLADMLEEDLIHAGYEVCGIARTVEEGVDLGSRHDPDLALLDLRLASGGLGTEIAARLDRGSGLGILYATGTSDQFHLTRADGDACLVKPYRSEDIVRALKIVEEVVDTGRTMLPFPGGFRLLEMSSVDAVEGTGIGKDAAGFTIVSVYPKFLPYTFSGRLPSHPALVRAYLRIPFAWRILGKQFLVIAERAADAPISGSLTDRAVSQADSAGMTASRE